MDVGGGVERELVPVDVGGTGRRITDATLEDRSAAERQIADLGGDVGGVGRLMIEEDRQRRDRASPAVFEDVEFETRAKSAAQGG